MAGSTSNYSILVDVQLNEQSIKQQLKAAGKDAQMNIGFKTDGADTAKKQTDAVEQSMRQLDNTTEDVSLTYQQFRQVLDSVVDVTAKLYEQVKQLDSAQTEFKKVSDLNGQALDNYTSKLAKMGQEVGRTGKPNRSEPVCCDGKAA